MYGFDSDIVIVADDDNGLIVDGPTDGGLSVGESILGDCRSCFK